MLQRHGQGHSGMPAQTWQFYVASLQCPASYAPSPHYQHSMQQSPMQTSQSPGGASYVPGMRAYYSYAAPSPESPLSVQPSYSQALPPTHLAHPSSGPSSFLTHYSSSNSQLGQNNPISPAMQALSALSPAETWTAPVQHAAPMQFPAPLRNPPLTPQLPH